jgi:hypothetical protein
MTTSLPILGHGKAAETAWVTYEGGVPTDHTVRAYGHITGGHVVFREREIGDERSFIILDLKLCH